MQAVEATAEAEQLKYKGDIDAEAQAILSITNYVVVLSQNWVLHGQNTWQGAYASHLYQDHSAWDTHILDELLQKFLRFSGAKSIPDLGEFAWRADKVLRLCFEQNSLSAAPCSAVHQLLDADASLSVIRGEMAVLDGWLLG